MSVPPLYNLVDRLYHLVMDGMPQFIQEKDKTSAFVLGSLGSYGVVRGAQYLSRRILPRKFNRNVLPFLEKTAAFCMTVVPLVSVAFRPELQDYVNYVINVHPTYTSGMVGVYFGTITGLLQDSLITIPRYYKKHSE